MDDIVSGCLLKFKYRMCTFADDDSKRCVFHCYSLFFSFICVCFVFDGRDVFFSLSFCPSMQFESHLIASFNRSACTAHNPFTCMSNMIMQAQCKFGWGRSFCDPSEAFFRSLARSLFLPSSLCVHSCCVCVFLNAVFLLNKLNFICFSLLFIWLNQHKRFGEPLYLCEQRKCACYCPIEWAKLVHYILCTLSRLWALNVLHAVVCARVFLHFVILIVYKRCARFTGNQRGTQCIKLFVILSLVVLVVFVSAVFLCWNSSSHSVGSGFCSESASEQMNNSNIQKRPRHNTTDTHDNEEVTFAKESQRNCGYIIHAHTEIERERVRNEDGQNQQN